MRPPPGAAGRLRVAPLASIVFALAASSPAYASLGGNESTVQSDQAQTQATRRILSSARYTVHELEAPTGGHVREFVSPAGMVFGVAWDGPSMPDLRQVLGTYFDRYTAAVATARRTRGAVFIDVPGLVVQSTGHMRAFTGSAYVPEALPEGVVADEVR